MLPKVNKASAVVPVACCCCLIFALMFALSFANGNTSLASYSQFGS